jgi:NAD(P)-dependent dehydrogenase (short-subunit alcohol dehydrogenase family)
MRCGTELAAFGIDVSLIAPGVIRTQFEATAASALGSFAATPYGGALTHYDRMSKASDRFAAEPIVVAKAIARAVRDRRPSALRRPRRAHLALWLRALLRPPRGTGRCARSAI